MTIDDAIFIEFLRQLWEQAPNNFQSANIQRAIVGINAADQDWKDRMLEEFAKITAPPVHGP
jgi:hypothetical protein